MLNPAGPTFDCPTVVRKLSAPRRSVHGLCCLASEQDVCVVLYATGMPLSRRNGDWERQVEHLSDVRQ
jgi:hypothetical protein